MQPLEERGCQSPAPGALNPRTACDFHSNSLLCLPSARVCVLWCLSFCLARSYVKGGHKKAGEPRAKVNKQEGLLTFSHT